MRAAFLDELINQAADLALHAHTALPLALGTYMSDVADFFASSAFGNFRKSQEGRAKTTSALFLRLDAICKQLNGLGRALSRR